MSMIDTIQHRNFERDLKTIVNDIVVFINNLPQTITTNRSWASKRKELIKFYRVIVSDATIDKKMLALQLMVSKLNAYVNETGFMLRVRQIYTMRGYGISYIDKYYLEKTEFRRKSNAIKVG